jgi:hypothetical protein
MKTLAVTAMAGVKNINHQSTKSGGGNSDRKSNDDSNN